MTRRLVLVLAFCTTVGCGSSFSIGCGVEPAPERSAGPAAAPSGGTQLVNVGANRGWQETGITVAPNQKFQLRYRSGAITDKDTKIADAHGSDYVCGDPGCCEPLPDERRGALVARIAGRDLSRGEWRRVQLAGGRATFSPRQRL